MVARMTLRAAVVWVLTAALQVSAADQDLASRPREGRGDLVNLPRHPLYKSLPHDNRRVLTIGDADELPNYVYDAKGVPDDAETAGAAAPDRPYGDTVAGYNLPDSYSSAPSYADPTLLSEVMKQADQANFRYPLATTVPPGNNRPSSASETGSAFVPTRENEVSPFALFPPQFHDLLEIPLHTYSNGSSFSPHHRYRPVGPLISKGYASTKIQGNTNQVHAPANQVTPKVSYTPNSVSQDNTKKLVETNQTTTKIITTTTTTTESFQDLYSSTDPPTSHAPSSRPSATHITHNPHTKNTHARPTTQPNLSEEVHQSFRPLSFTVPNLHHSRPNPTLLNTDPELTFTDKHSKPSPPSSIPPLRYTRRPAVGARPTTHVTAPPRDSFVPTTPRSTPHQLVTTRRSTSHQLVTTLRSTSHQPVTTLRSTSHQPTTLRSTSHHPTTRRSTSHQPVTTPFPTTQPPTTTRPNNLWRETFENTQKLSSKKPVHAQTYGTRIPSRNSQLHPTPVEQEVFSAVEQEVPSLAEKVHPTSSDQPKPSVVDRQNEGGQSFRPSKVDPFLPSGREPSNFRPLADENQSDHLHTGSQSLPPVVNSYDRSTRRPQPLPVINADSTNFPSQPLSPLPPPPQPPSRPFLPPPPIPPHSSRPSLPPGLQSLPSLSPPPPPPPSPASFLPPPPEFPEQPSAQSRPHQPIQDLTHLQHPQFALVPPAPFPGLPADHSVPLKTFSQSHKPISWEHRPFPPAKIHPPFQIVPAAETLPPRSQTVAEQPEPGFTLPAEAGNLPRRRVQEENLVRPQLSGARPNVLPQFRPNAPPQQETFSSQGFPTRTFNTQPRPLYPDRRPVLSKRPSFLDNFNFFERDPVNRRRGETGPLLEANSAGNKVATKQKPDTEVRYQLTHGPAPKHAQKVMVVGPFQQPPPGAPIINLPNRDPSPQVTDQDSIFLPPPPPPLPSRRISPPPSTMSESTDDPVPEVKPQPPISRRTQPIETVNGVVPPMLPTPEALVENPPELLPREPEVTNIGMNNVPGVVYGRPVDPAIYSTPADKTMTNVGVSYNVSRENTSSSTNISPSYLSTLDSQYVPVSDDHVMEEVSDEHKEGIIAGKVRFPPMPIVERTGEDGQLRSGIIPVPVPIYASRQELPPQSFSDSFWSFLGFGNSKPEPVAAERRDVVESTRIKKQPRTKSKTRTRRRRPRPNKVNRFHDDTPLARAALSSSLQLPDVSKSHLVYGSNPRLSQTPPPATILTPDLATPVNKLHPTSTPSSDAPSTPPSDPPSTPSSDSPSTPSSDPPSTQNPHLSSTRYPDPSSLRPVYKHTSTTEAATSSSQQSLTTVQPAESPVTEPSPTLITRNSATPFYITEYTPYYPIIPNEREELNNFKAPIIESSSYGGWKAVEEQPAPADGRGGVTHSPVVPSARGNVPAIIIGEPIADMDEEVVTGVISDRMGEAQDDQLVKFSSRLNVETPGIVRSYWVKAPVLA
nr:nascent polypeptide-associated complex subunit alpha, muscle-specific form-like [Procambarus clarkii]